MLIGWIRSTTKTKILKVPKEYIPGMGYISMKSQALLSFNSIAVAIFSFHVPMQIGNKRDYVNRQLLLTIRMPKSDNVKT